MDAKKNIPGPWDYEADCRLFRHAVVPSSRGLKAFLGVGRPEADEEERAERRREYARRWRAENRERLAEKARQWREANRERWLQWKRQRYQSHREQVARENKAHRARRVEALRLEDPEEYQAYVARARESKRRMRAKLIEEGGERLLQFRRRQTEAQQRYKARKRQEAGGLGAAAPQVGSAVRDQGTGEGHSGRGQQSRKLPSWLAGLTGVA